MNYTETCARGASPSYAFVQGADESLCGWNRTRELVDWRNLGPARGKRRAPVSAPEPALAVQFHRHYQSWRTETAALSLAGQKALHPAYQRIIGMGAAALPLIFAEMAKAPDHWFWALHAITGQDPVPEDARGRLPLMTRAWLEWAKNEGIYG